MANSRELTQQRQAAMELNIASPEELFGCFSHSVLKIRDWHNLYRQFIHGLYKCYLLPSYYYELTTDCLRLILWLD